VAGDNLPERRPPPEEPPPRRPGQDGLDERQVRQLALAGATVLVVSLLLIFIIENSDPVRVSFVFFSADISLIWVIVLSALAGAVAGIVVARLVRRRFFGDGPPR
jgi:uncharacterized integral membrane protein